MTVNMTYHLWCCYWICSHFFLLFQTYVLMLYSTLSRSQYDFTLPQVSFTSTGYHKHITLTFNPTVRYRCFIFCLFFLNPGSAYICCLMVFSIWEYVPLLLQRTTDIRTYSQTESLLRLLIGLFILELMCNVCFPHSVKCLTRMLPKAPT